MYIERVSTVPYLVSIIGQIPVQYVDGGGNKLREQVPYLVALYVRYGYSTQTEAGKIERVCRYRTQLSSYVRYRYSTQTEAGICILREQVPYPFSIIGQIPVQYVDGGGNKLRVGTVPSSITCQIPVQYVDGGGNILREQQCCGSGMFIPDPDFFPSRISDPGSRILDLTMKRGGKKLYQLSYLFCSFSLFYNSKLLHI